MSPRKFHLCLSLLLFGVSCAAPMEGEQVLDDKVSDDSGISGYIFNRSLRVHNHYTDRIDSEDGVLEFKGELSPDYDDGIIFDADRGDALLFKSTSLWSYAFIEIFDNVIFEWVGPSPCAGGIPRTGGHCEANDPNNWRLVRFDTSRFDDFLGAPRTKFVAPRDGRYMVLLHTVDRPHERRTDWKLRMAMDDSYPRGSRVTTVRGTVLCPGSSSPVANAVIGLEGGLEVTLEDGTFDFGIRRIGPIATVWVEDPSDPSSIHYEDVRVESGTDELKIFMPASSCDGF